LETVDNIFAGRVRGAKPRATADGVVRARVIAGGLPGRLGSTVAATT
jgi:hypothetical protein